jgi:DNA primase
VGIVAEDVAHVRGVTDIVALIGEYTPLKRVGRRYTGLCPFHSERTASFSVNAEEGLYYCFGCQASGDAITFVRAIEGCDFVEAVERLAERAGVVVRHDSSDRSGPGRDKLQVLKDAMERAVAFYHQRLLEGRDAGQARQYLRSRGYGSDVVRQFRLGWAPGGSSLSRSLGGKDKVLLEAGLAREGNYGLMDSFAERVIFPIFDPSGAAIALGGRVLPGKSGSGPKYRNSPETPIYSKRRTLYGLNWARQAVVQSQEVVVCEGYTDVIGMFMSGVPRAVATCGTALTEDHFKLLGRFARRVVLAFDADAAGESAAARFYEWERTHDLEVAVAPLPSGSDPGDLASRDPAALREAVEGARPFLQFRLDRVLTPDRLKTAESRARAAEESVAMIAEHPNELVRDQYMTSVADRTRIDLPRLRQLVERSRADLLAGRRSDGAASGGAGGRPGAGSRPGVGPRGGLRPGRTTAPEDEDPPPWVGRPGGTSPEEDGATSREARARTGKKARSGPGWRAGRDAIALAIHSPEAMANRLDACLFSDPVQRRAFRILASSASLREAIESADDEVADLLRQLVVSEPTTEPDHTIVALSRGAATAALLAAESDARVADAEGDVATLAEVAGTITWLKQQLEAMSEPGVNETPPPDVIHAADRLVAWLSAHGEDDG